MATVLKKFIYIIILINVVDAIIIYSLNNVNNIIIIIIITIIITIETTVGDKICDIATLKQELDVLRDGSRKVGENSIP